MKETKRDVLNQCLLILYQISVFVPFVDVLRSFFHRKFAFGRQDNDSVQLSDCHRFRGWSVHKGFLFYPVLKSSLQGKKWNWPKPSCFWSICYSLTDSFTPVDISGKKLNVHLISGSIWICLKKQKQNNVRLEWCFHKSCVVFSLLWQSCSY